MENSLIEIFARNLKAAGKMPLTIQNYCQNVILAERFIQEKYGCRFTIEDAPKINGQMFKDWFITFDRYKESTKHTVFSSIRVFLKDMASSGFFPAAMINAVPITKRRQIDDIVDDEDDEGESREYTSEQVVALIHLPSKTDAYSVRDRAIVALLFATGLRCSELCSLNVGSIRNMKNGALRVIRKGGALKRVEVADFAIPYIEDYLEDRPGCTDDEPLFLGRRGDRIVRRTVWEILKHRQQVLGLRTGVHNTRHTFLSDVGRRTNPIVARDAAGHSSVSITNTYLHNTSKDLHTAVSESPWAIALTKKQKDN